MTRSAWPFVSPVRGGEGGVKVTCRRGSNERTQKLKITHAGQVGHSNHGGLFLGMHASALVLGSVLSPQQVVVAARTLVVVLTVPNHCGKSFVYQGLSHVAGGVMTTWCYFNDGVASMVL